MEEIAEFCSNFNNILEVNKITIEIPNNSYYSIRLKLYTLIEHFNFSNT